MKNMQLWVLVYTLSRSLLEKISLASFKLMAVAGNAPYVSAIIPIRSSRFLNIQVHCVNMHVIRESKIDSYEIPCFGFVSVCCLRRKCIYQWVHRRFLETRKIYAFSLRFTMIFVFSRGLIHHISFLENLSLKIDAM